MDQSSSMPRTAGEPAAVPAPGAAADSLDAAELFRHRRQVSIRHEQETYYLRLTRNGKLILTK